MSILISKEELNKVIDAADTICIRCLEDTLNNPGVCNACSVRKLCDALVTEHATCCNKCNYSREVGKLCVCNINGREIDVKEGCKPNWCPCNASNVELNKRKE